jgi:hypothetical protein
VLGGGVGLQDDENPKLDDLTIFASRLKGSYDADSLPLAVVATASATIQGTQPALILDLRTMTPCCRSTLITSGRCISILLRFTAELGGRRTKSGHRSRRRFVMARSARLAKPEAIPTRFEGGDRGQVHWTCGLGSLNRGAQQVLEHWQYHRGRTVGVV